MEQTTENIEPQTEPWTVIRLLQWTTTYFKKSGADSPRLDAEILLADACNCSRIELYARFNTEPSEAEKTTFRQMVQQRIQGNPVAYLVGYKEFYSLKLTVDESVLVPRPETEHLVVEAIDRWKQRCKEVTSRPLRIVDVGTGSGAIAITLAKHLPECQVTAIDQSAAALRIAKQNVLQHNVENQVTLVQGDLLAPLAGKEQQDIICSNPPYVSTAEYEQLPATVLNFEPKEALLAGPKGTECIERLIQQARDHLAPGGHLILELSPMIHEACRQLVRAADVYEEPALIKDLAGLHRVLSVRRKS